MRFHALLFTWVSSFVVLIGGDFCLTEAVNKVPLLSFSCVLQDLVRPIAGGEEDATQYSKEISARIRHAYGNGWAGKELSSADVEEIPTKHEVCGIFWKTGPQESIRPFFFFFFGAVLFVLGFRVWWKWKRSLFRPGSRKVGIGVVAEPFAKWDPRIKIRMFFLLQFSSF
jgi:hypothetical protein